MTELQIAQMLNLLVEIRDIQRMMSERQAESLALQKEQISKVRTQLDHAERIQVQAEQLQGKSNQLVTTSHRLVKALIPILIGFLVFLFWRSLSCH